IGAGLTGLILLVQQGLGWEAQLVIFAVLSVVAGIAGRIWVSHRPTETDEPNLNRRGEQYIGRVFTLDGAIVNGVGKIKVGDSHWRVSGDDMPAGSQVSVVDVEGVTLRVEKAPVAD
ncbi:MAG: NfeD family protein, partial [Magnetovibrio sp.]|nr:NfeD family protein [Magnetovibrio sp.]